MWDGTSSHSKRKGTVSWLLEPVPDPDEVPPVHHGGVPPGRGRTPLIDFSLSTNPFGPPPFLDEALERAKAEVASYPDTAQRDLAKRIEGKLGLDAGEVLPAGSASELLRAAISAYGAKRAVLLPRFTYEEYGRVASCVGAKTVRLPMRNLSLDPASVAKMVSEESLVVLPNPGTPFASLLTLKDIATIVEAVERRHSLLIIDESYLPFVHEGRTASLLSPSVLVVFSWSKALGTPGLPFGHAAGHPAILRGLKPHMLPWSVGPFARHLALLALEGGHWEEETLARTRRLSEVVRKRLNAASRANYFTVESTSGRSLYQRLLAKGYVVRDLTTMGLPRHVRFGVRTEAETSAFLDDLDGILSR